MCLYLRSFLYVDLPGWLDPSVVEAAALEAEKYGKKRNNRISVFFIGQDRVGKTSLKKNLIGKPFDSQEPSTVGIEVDIVEVDEKDEKHWQLTTDQQLMASDDLVNRAVVEAIAKKIKRPDKIVKNPPEDKNVDRPGNELKLWDSNNGDPTENGSADAAAGGGESGEGRGREQRGGGRGGWLQESTKKRYDSLDDKMMQAVKEQMLKVDKYDDDDLNKIRLVLNDVAGQSLFYDIHSIFLRSQSLFVLVVALDKKLADEAKPLFVEQGKNPIPIENYLVETNLDYANRWMAALHNIYQCTESHASATSAGFDLPATILVFTKPDLVTEEEEKKAKENVLNSFTCYGYRGHIVETFVIDNTISESSQIEKLREKIFEISRIILRTQGKIPINWLKLERGLATVMESKPYITYKDVEKLGKESQVVERLPEAIKTLHQQNVVFHFPDDEKARSLVVLDPQWLIKLFTSVINVPPSYEQASTHAKFWMQLTDRGQLSKELLRIVLERHGKHMEALTRMMEMVNLICRWNEETWLVPSMAEPQKARKEVEKRLRTCCAPSLYLDFEGGYVPLGLFTRLLVILIREYQIYFAAIPSLSSYSSLLPVKENNAEFYVILVQHLSRIQVALSTNGSQITNEELEKIASRLKSFIRAAVEEIRHTSPVYQSLNYDFTVKCKCTHKEHKKCPRHQLVDCSSEDCIMHFVPLGDFQHTRRCFLSCEFLDDETARPWLDRKGKSNVYVSCQYDEFSVLPSSRKSSSRKSSSRT